MCHVMALRVMLKKHCVQAVLTSISWLSQMGTSIASDDFLDALDEQPFHLLRL